MASKEQNGVTDIAIAWRFLRARSSEAEQPRDGVGDGRMIRRKVFSMVIPAVIGALAATSLACNSGFETVRPATEDHCSNFIKDNSEIDGLERRFGIL